jgi:hypothetical protein
MIRLETQTRRWMDGQIAECRKKVQPKGDIQSERVRHAGRDTYRHRV